MEHNEKHMMEKEFGMIEMGAGGAQVLAALGDLVIARERCKPFPGPPYRTLKIAEFKGCINAASQHTSYAGAGDFKGMWRIQEITYAGQIHKTEFENGQLTA